MSFQTTPSPVSPPSLDDSSTWDEGTRAYFEEVNKVFNNNEGIWISNGKPIHAAYIIKSFFERAKPGMTIRLFTGSLDQERKGTPVYRSQTIIDAAKAFLQKGDTKLHILLQKGLDGSEENNLEEHPFTKMLLDEDAGSRCSIRKASSQVITWLKDKDIDSHFMTMGDHAIRLETNDPEAKAFASINTKDAPQKCINFFDDFLMRDAVILL